MTSANPRPYRWPPTWLTNLLDRRAGASVFVIEAWVGKRWQPIARSDYEASARRLFNQASMRVPWRPCFACAVAPMSGSRCPQTDGKTCGSNGGEAESSGAMTILTLRRIRQDRFEVTGPDIESVTFKTRVEAGTGAFCRGCSSTLFSRIPATSCSSMPARSAWRASCQSGWVRLTVPVAPATG